MALTKKEKLKCDYPDKFFCDCGKEISEDTLIGCGMCDSCYKEGENILQ